MGIVRAAKRFSVNRDDFFLNLLAGCLHPLHKTLLEGLRIEELKESPDGVMRGNPIFQLQKLAKPIFLCFPETRNGGEPIGPTNHRTDRQDDDFMKRIVRASLPARIF
jgi:hypothetical protein